MAGLLRTKKIDSLQIHSDLEQQERTLILIKFDNKSCRIMVATDLASRGLDVKDVSVVINYDLPSDHELYVHRIGRTGRAGQEGLALSLYTHQERAILRNIGEYLKTDCLTMDLNELEKFKGDCHTSIYVDHLYQRRTQGQYTSRRYLGGLDQGSGA